MLRLISLGKGKALSLFYSLSFFLFPTPLPPTYFSSLLTDWVSKSSSAGIEVELQTGLLCTFLNAFSSKLNN